jgi:serine/threonine protein phosphatase PrpC
MISRTHSHLPVAALSHPGMAGKNNEDSYAVSAYQIGVHDQTPVLFAVVCDGIGGHWAGEVASNLAVTQLNMAIAASDGRYPVDTLQAAFQKASQVIFSQSQSDPAQKGMGSTCVCALIVGDRLYAASMGDSRIYYIFGEHIQQLSKDHTWIQEALDAGLITLDQVPGHPNAHVIRRYLGYSGVVEPDLRIYLQGGETDLQALNNQGMRLQPGSFLLLCSDGLTDLVNDAELSEIIKTNELDQVPQRLIDLACQRGGHDNITAIVISVPERKSQEKKKYFPTAPWFITMGCLSLITIISVVVLAFIGWRIFH